MCDYVCELDAKTIEKARRELNEDPAQRNGQIQALKDWIHEQKWLSIPTDNFFLVGILRGTKFSQVLARELITYIAHEPSKRSRWSLARNPVSPEFRKCMEVGHNVILPKKDAEGQTIIIARPGVVDTSGDPYSAEALYQATAGMMYKLAMDESVQVNGVVVILDFTGLTMKHISFGFPIYKKAAGEAKKHAYKVPINMDPHFLKELHYYNTGQVFEYLHGMAMKMEWVKERMKIVKTKIVVHGCNFETVYDHVDKSLLPDEYLPDDYEGPSAGPIKEIVGNFIESMSAPHVLDWFDRLHSVTGVDFSLKPSNDEPREFFRKLKDS
ncbi:hypothetical protein ScPMuIL_001022 [Solemya velum]